MDWPKLEDLLEHVGRLHALRINAVPVCCPTPEGWCSASWHATPCPSAGKAPLIAGYPSRGRARLPIAQLLAEIRELYPCNLGAVLPVGCAVVEADSAAAEAELLELAGAAGRTAPARERRDGSGRALIFRVDPSWPLATRTKRGRHSAIDILTAGSLFITPPSIHASMVVRTWVPGRAPWQVPIPLLPDALQALALETDAARSPIGASAAEQDGFLPHVSERVRFLISSRRDIRLLWYGQKKSGDMSASGIDYSLAVALAGEGVPALEAAEALAARDGVHRCTAEYALRTVRKAMERIR